MPLKNALAKIRALLPEATWVEVAAPLDRATIEVQRDAEGFAELMRSLGIQLACFEWTLLTEDHFTHQQEHDDEQDWNAPSLFAMPAMQPFRSRIGEAWLLRIFFVHSGFRFEYHERASWWMAFSEALDQAYTQSIASGEREAVERRAQHQLELERRAELLRELLPNDPTFIALACVPRPSIMAMRQRVMDVLTERLGESANFYSGQEDVVVRELAGQLRERHRKTRR